MKTYCSAVAMILVVLVVGSMSAFWQRRRDEVAIERLRRQVEALVADGENLSAGATVSAREGLAAYAAAVILARSSAELGSQASDNTVANSTPAPQSPPSETAAHDRSYETAFANDPSDFQWETRAKGIVDGSLLGLLPEGSKVRSFACHASLCRLETTHRDRAAFFAFLETVALNPTKVLWNAGIYSTSLSDDPNETVMVTYLAREGEGLPVLGQSEQ